MISEKTPALLSVQSEEQASRHVALDESIDSPQHQRVVKALQKYIRKLPQQAKHAHWTDDYVLSNLRNQFRHFKETANTSEEDQEAQHLRRARDTRLNRVCCLTYHISRSLSIHTSQ